MSGAAQNPGDGASAPPDVETVRAQLNRILADPRFVRSERHSGFLRFIVEKTLAGAGGELKEYVIAAEVYGKSSSYDPSADSIVRVEAARLRSKLLEYYATNGRQDPVRIEFPRGRYVPEFIAQPPVAGRDSAGVVSPGTEPLSSGPPELASVPASSRWGRNSIIGAAFLIMIVAVLMGWRMIGARTTIRSTPASIAVLPFTSFDPDPEAEAFAAELTEQVSDALSRSGNVRVAERSSVLPFRTKPDSIVSIGQQLQVQAILDGSVRSEDGRVRVTALLSNAADGYRIWTEAYERKKGTDQNGLRALSSLIANSLLADGRWRTRDAPQTPAAREARQICRPLLLALDRGQHDHLLQGNPQGEHHLDLDAVMGAVHGFERAITLDPGYSPAYGGLALAYLHAADYDERLSARVPQAAIRGLEIDANLAEAHFALGYHLFLKEWDFTGAEREFNRTLELNPRDVTAGRLFADCAALLGDSESGMAALRRTQRLVPNSPVMAVQIGIMLYHARLFKELEVYAREIQPRRPGVALVHWLLGLALEQQGKYAEAAAAFEKSLDLSPHDPRATPALGHVYGLLGRREAARKLIAESRDGALRGWSSGPVGIALIYLGLGDRESSLSWLETAYNIREGALPYIKLDPRCDPLRSDPRFVALMRKLRL